MPNIDPRYIPIVTLQGIFVDKNDGTPLAAGVAHFFKDSERQVYKKIYKLTGAPGSYSFTELDNPVTLTPSGTFQDNLGKDITVYLYPYADDNITVERYFIDVYDAFGNSQYEREAVPYLEEQITSGISLEEYNYFIDGQFECINKSLTTEFEYDVSDSLDDNKFYISGHQTDFDNDKSKNDFYGDFFFYKDSVSDSEDIITIKKIVLGDGIIDANPSTYFRYTCNNPGTFSLFKSFGKILGNSRLFSGGKVTVQVKARSPQLSAPTFSFEQVFGINGSAPVLIVSPPLTTKVDFDTISYTFDMPSVENKGIKDNDYLIFYIDMPTDSTCTVDFENVQINKTESIFPYFKRTKEELSSFCKSSSLPAMPQNIHTSPFENEGKIATLKYDFTNGGLPYYELEHPLPVGSALDWNASTDVPIRKQYLAPLGQPASKARFKNLYDVWGTRYGDSGGTTATLSSNIVTVIDIYSTADPPDAEDGDGSYATGFTFNRIGYNPQISEITCNAASTLCNNNECLSYIKYNTSSSGGEVFTWYVCFFKNNYMILKNSIFVYPYINIVPINLQDGWDDDDVATALAEALNPICFQIIDRRGYASRVPDRNSGRDLLRNLRTPAANGTDLTAGSTQLDYVKSHVHAITKSSANGPNISPQGWWADGTGSPANTQPNTGAQPENTMKNIYIDKIYRF